MKVEPQISRNSGLRSVGVCSAYPLFDKIFIKVYADERRFLVSLFIAYFYCAEYL